MKNERKIKDFLKKLGKLCEDENIFIEAQNVYFVTADKHRDYTDKSDRFIDEEVLNHGYKIDLLAIEDLERDGLCLEAIVAEIGNSKTW